MPNGHSGGFVIEKADLKHLIQALPADTAVAKVTVRSSPLRTVTAAELARLVDECPHDRIEVEEQDHTFYVIHLRNKPELVWIMVASETPLFLELRQRHGQRATGHAE